MPQSGVKYTLRQRKTLSARLFNIRLRPVSSLCLCYDSYLCPSSAIAVNLLCHGCASNVPPRSPDRYVGLSAELILLTVAASIQKILNLNHDLHTSDDVSQDQPARGFTSHSTPILNEDGDPIWKVLVFDGLGRDVISSVLRVNDLRAWGVTIHLYACAPAVSCLH